MVRIKHISRPGRSSQDKPAHAFRAGLLRFLRERSVLAVSFVAAAATAFAVPPDAAYLGYFDLKVLACLLSILALVAALRNVGVFESVSRRLVAHVSNSRAAVAALVGATLVLSMVVTNDMALIMMLPLATATLLKAGWGRLVPFTFIMQNMAANLGGMIVPFGNPQNLYLFEEFSIPLPDFLAVMAVPFLASCVLIFACCGALVKPDAADAAALASHAAARRAAFERRGQEGSAHAGGGKKPDAADEVEDPGVADGGRSGVASGGRLCAADGGRLGAAGAGGPGMAGEAASRARGDEGAGSVGGGKPGVAGEGEADWASGRGTSAEDGFTRRNFSELDSENPTHAFARRLAGARILRPGERRARTLLYAALLLLVVLAVFRLVPYPVALVVVFGTLAFADRSALRAVDYSLVLTFACFFVFSGNMARIPAVESCLGWLLDQSALVTGAAVSQVISNVPAAILLSHMTGEWAPLLVGVNVGGAGTPVASLATLITINHYRRTLVLSGDDPGSKRMGAGRFIAVSTAWGFGFLVFLLVFCSAVMRF